MGLALSKQDVAELAPGLAACPACVVAPAALDLASRPDLSNAKMVLSLPSSHCAACISTVEKALEAHPLVKSARLNLTLKRVSIEAAPDTAAQTMIDVLAGVGYEAYELDPSLLSLTETDRQGRDLLMRLGVAFFSMMNVMLLSVAVWSGADGVTRDMFHWISAAIALPTVIFAGQPFFKSAWQGLKVGRFGMDFPISLALVLASGISLFETFNSGHHAYFDAAVMLCFFLLLGRYLDHRTRAMARSAAQELAALEVGRASVLEDGQEKIKPLAEVAVGDLVLVRPGGRLPVDGVVVQGASEIDRSLITGESLPVAAFEGSQLCAGEVNLTGPLVLRVSAAGKDSSLHQMADLVAVAETARNSYTSLADRASRAYSPLVHILSFSAFAYWMWSTGGNIRTAVNISAAVLIITCPCALGLAVPAVVTAASGKLFRKGLLIKSSTALERLAEVDTVVFDKTGTLTLGTPKPDTLEHFDEKQLSIALGLAQGSSHPLAMALTHSLQRQNVTPTALENVVERPGYGIEAEYEGQPVRLGRAQWLGAEGLRQTATYLRIGSAPAIAFGFQDQVRPGAAALVGALQASGKRVILLSGDSEAAVASMATVLGIEEWHSGVLPAQKAEKIVSLNEQGAKVLMVGDGLNDTGALASAHVSISPASALDAARVASDIVLLGQDMAPIADALRISSQAIRRIVENFKISAAYNVVAVPLALVGMATPLAAALAMSISSITVSLNALRLK